MSDTTTARDATAGDPVDVRIDADRPADALTPPYADDFDITDLQQWIDLCA
jgi:hypothetical protein